MLGWKQITDNLWLGGGDFIMQRTNPAGPPPDGTVAEIKWATGETWTAEIDGDTAYWREEAEDVAAIETGTPFELWVHYPNNATSTTDDFLWIEGYGHR